MESQVVRRRANVIMAHLASDEDIIISATATHVFPMRCSSSLNSVMRRCDNRMTFARQGSTSQGCYMRQASIEQGNCRQPESIFKTSTCVNNRSSVFEEPAFSRPSLVEPGIPTAEQNDSVVQGQQCAKRSLEAPMFARPQEKCGHQLQSYKDTTHNSGSKGIEWSPRMDVVESSFSYMVTLEIPGVSIDNIKVEVHDQSLIVKGNRSNWSSGDVSATKSDSCYHRREIMHGPYRIVWPLPTNANKGNISAEIQDGLLRIMIPKLSGLRWLTKAHM